MGALFVTLLLPLLLFPTATSGAGTVIAFYSISNGPSQTAVGPTWAVPDLASGSPLGCSQLPLAPASAKFTWSSTNGLWKCDYVIFYASSSCTPSLDGSEPVVKASGSSTTVSSFASSSLLHFKTIPSSKALQCASNSDPCAKGCADSNAQCSSQSSNISESTSVSYKVYLTKDCSTCKPGFSKSPQTGLCTAPDPCASARCPAGTTCDSSSGAAVCKCTVDNFVYDPASNSCKDTTPQLWLSILNPLRTTPAQPLSWSTSLATTALGGAKAQVCPGPGETAALTKIPAGNPKAFSENDAYLNPDTAEGKAVQLWLAGKPALAARIKDAHTTEVGCAKSTCNTQVGGTFFVCLFSPFTY